MPDVGQSVSWTWGPASDPPSGLAQSQVTAFLHERQQAMIERDRLAQAIRAYLHGPQDDPTGLIDALASLRGRSDATA
jgi:hypothetical protein